MMRLLLLCAALILVLGGAATGTAAEDAVASAPVDPNAARR